MRYIDEEQRPAVLGKGSLAAALLLHALFFVCCWVLSMPFRIKEMVIPIELTFEAPPTTKEEPQPKPQEVKPKPKPPEPEPPKIEDKKIDAVVKEPPKKKPPKEKPKAKPKEEKPKEPEKPKKTAAELRKERLEKMRSSATKDTTPRVKSPAPSGTGKKLDKDWQKLLNQGYKPGETTQLAASEEQRCVSLIRKAFHDKWEQPAWTSSMRMMFLEVTFGPGGKVVGYRLVQSSGDAKADRSVISAASRVGAVAGLSSDFLAKNKTVRIDFKVTPQ